MVVVQAVAVAMAKGRAKVRAAYEPLKTEVREALFEAAREAPVAELRATWGVAKAGVGVVVTEALKAAWTVVKAVVRVALTEARKVECGEAARVQAVNKV